MGKIWSAQLLNATLKVSVRYEFVMNSVTNLSNGRNNKVKMDKWKQVRYDHINPNSIQFSFSIVDSFTCTSKNEEFDT